MAKAGKKVVMSNQIPDQVLEAILTVVPHGTSIQYLPKIGWSVIYKNNIVLFLRPNLKDAWISGPTQPWMSKEFSEKIQQKTGITPQVHENEAFQNLISHLKWDRIKFISAILSWFNMKAGPGLFDEDIVVYRKRLGFWGLVLDFIFGSEEVGHISKDFRDIYSMTDRLAWETLSYEIKKNYGITPNLSANLIFG